MTRGSLNLNTCRSGLYKSPTSSDWLTGERMLSKMNISLALTYYLAILVFHRIHLVPS